MSERLPSSRSSKQWRCEVRKREVDRDMLEDLGVNIILDDDSSSSSRQPNQIY
jgi:hypothetical protein